MGNTPVRTSENSYQDFAALIKKWHALMIELMRGDEKRRAEFVQESLALRKLLTEFFQSMNKPNTGVAWVAWTNRVNSTLLTDNVPIEKDMEVSDVMGQDFGYSDERITFLQRAIDDVCEILELMREDRAKKTFYNGRSLMNAFMRIVFAFENGFSNWEKGIKLIPIETYKEMSVSPYRTCGSV